MQAIFRYLNYIFSYALRLIFLEILKQHFRDYFSVATSVLKREFIFKIKLFWSLLDWLIFMVGDIHSPQHWIRIA